MGIYRWLFRSARRAAAHKVEREREIASLLALNPSAELIAGLRAIAASGMTAAQAQLVAAAVAKGGINYMADPSRAVREGVYWRDENACCCCGRTDGLTFQHRRAVGQGGSRIRPSYADGLTACASCNARFESDLQTLALLNGWKVRRWVADPALVPYYHAATDRWYALSGDLPARREITRAEMVRMMTAVYGERHPATGEAMRS